MWKSHLFKHLTNLTTVSPLSLSKHSTTKHILQKQRPTPYLSSTTHFSSSFSTSALTPTTTSTSSSSSSSSSSYLSVKIRCPKNAADMLSEALLSFGASSASMDEDDGCYSSDEICIESIFPELEDLDVRLSQAADSVGLKKTPNYEVKIGDQYDWVQKTQESFHPVEVAEGVWVVPEWRSPPDIHATNIILNPGLAFGTGDHPTTKLCLLLLKNVIKGGEVFLDYGTGSGILAIAALKFGAALSVGFDVDPQAITSARYNAALNDLRPEAMQLHLVSERADDNGSTVESKYDKYDVVIANVLLNPLLDLADHIVSHAKPCAIVGLSGILSEQIPAITNRYSSLLEDISVSQMDGWACITGRKKNNLATN